ncbi:MAG TPA: tRNA (adenosine(37)-N6)-threonylcarbamoyltransferase complex ATPase subunit type 1 TsaE [Beutenbergiaceae bacterium]|nr:tRNA (adenosine(37)-N6)-threonylcarbamoyltransferase complex ATPase subunit type 1 TsaE [Beutenbergiaceae bacterium]
MRLELPDEQATRKLGQKLATIVQPGDLIILNGGLGAGKTTLTQGIAVGLNVEGTVTSPTFIIARTHPGSIPLVHVDAYRLATLDEVDDLDLDSELEESLTVVEWGEGKVEDLSPNRLEITMVRPRGEDEHGRYAVIHPVGPRWQDQDFSFLTGE